MSMSLLACLTVGVVNYIDSAKRFDEFSDNDLNGTVEIKKWITLDHILRISAML